VKRIYRRRKTKLRNAKYAYLELNSPDDVDAALKQKWWVLRQGKHVKMKLEKLQRNKLLSAASLPPMKDWVNLRKADFEAAKNEKQ